MTDRASNIKEILDSYDRSQEALNFTPRSDNDIRAQMIATAVREWNGELVAAVHRTAMAFNEAAADAPIGSRERHDLIMRMQGAMDAYDAIAPYDASRPIAEAALNKGAP